LEDAEQAIKHEELKLHMESAERVEAYSLKSDQANATKK